MLSYAEANLERKKQLNANKTKISVVNYNARLWSHERICVGMNEKLLRINEICVSSRELLIILISSIQAIKRYIKEYISSVRYENDEFIILIIANLKERG